MNEQGELFDGDMYFEELPSSVSNILHRIRKKAVEFSEVEPNDIEAYERHIELTDAINHEFEFSRFDYQVYFTGTILANMAPDGFEEDDEPYDVINADSIHRDPDTFVDYISGNLESFVVFRPEDKPPAMYAQIRINRTLEWPHEFTRLVVDELVYGKLDECQGFGLLTELEERLPQKNLHYIDDETVIPTDQITVMFEELLDIYGDFDGSDSEWIREMTSHVKQIEAVMFPAPSDIVVRALYGMQRDSATGEMSIVTSDNGIPFWGRYQGLEVENALNIPDVMKTLISKETTIQPFPMPSLVLTDHNASMMGGTEALTLQIPVNQPLAIEAQDFDFYSDDGGAY